MEGYLYILQSQKNPHYYVGSTIDVIRGLEEHNIGKNKSTAKLRPLSLVFVKKYLTIKEARQVEYKIKRFKSRKIIERIVQNQEIIMGP